MFLDPKTGLGSLVVALFVKVSGSILGREGIIILYSSVIPSILGFNFSYLSQSAFLFRMTQKISACIPEVTLTSTHYTIIKYHYLGQTYQTKGADKLRVIMRAESGTLRHGPSTSKHVMRHTPPRAVSTSWLVFMQARLV